MEEAEEFINCIKEVQRHYNELKLLYQRAMIFCPKYAQNQEWQRMVSFGSLGPYVTQVDSLIAFVRNSAKQEQRLAQEAKDAQK